MCFLEYRTVACPRCRLGELRQRERLVAEHVSLEDAARAFERAVVAAEAVVQHGGREACERDDPALTLRRGGIRDRRDQR